MYTRQQLKDRLKSSRGLSRARQDGLLTDDLIHEAIDDAIRQVSIDCNLLPVKDDFPLVAGQWEYPMTEEVLNLRKVYYVDSSGTYEPLTYLAYDELLDWRDPAQDTGNEPLYFSYPLYQGRVIQPYAMAPVVHDYIPASHVTADHIRTIEDSGINLGKTLDGTRISPNDIVHNVTRDSYGYVEVLDVITEKAGGTADAGTGSTQLLDSAVNFVATNVAVDDIICTPRAGVVASYGFVSEVAANTLKYLDIRGAAASLQPGNTYKIGEAQKIRLSMATPHPGLRDGSANTFSAGTVQATMNLTTFTATRCTGSATTGAAVNHIAIAAGGSHGRITAVEDNYIDVEYWIGGMPADGEVVSIQDADEYQVETRVRRERVMWIRPTPSASDVLGTESIVVLYNKMPLLPTEDHHVIEVPDRYRQPLLRCLYWQAAELAGIYDPDQIDRYEGRYKRDVREYQGDIYRPPEQVMTAMGNRRGGKVRGYRDQGPSGIRWNLDI